MDITEIIKEPFFSSKRRSFLAQNKFVLTFLVSKNANKVMIKQAMWVIFGVRPLEVNILNRKPKPARKTLRSRENFTKARKVAYISLSQADFMNLRRAIEGESMPEESVSGLSDVSEQEVVVEPSEADSKEEIEVKEEAKDSEELSPEPEEKPAEDA